MGRGSDKAISRDNINLEEFLDAKVIIKLKTEEIYIGRVDIFKSAADSDEGEDSIGVMTVGNGGKWLFKSEIASIEAI